MTTTRLLAKLYWPLTVALLAAGVALVFAWVPDEATMGPVQKIFYLHFPVAINTFLACLVAAVASLAYLLSRQPRWDALALAAVRTAVLLCTIVLLTGMIWAHSAWGVWWDWTPRLTFSLVLWLLYAAYLVIRPAVEPAERRALVAAIYGLVAFLDVPLVYFSTKLMPDLHPASISLADPRMQWTLAFWFLPVTLLTAGFVHAGYRAERAQRPATTTDAPATAAPTAAHPQPGGAA